MDAGHLEPALSSICNILNSNFFTSLVGSLAGALGGAVAAQRIIEKSTQRKEDLAELRSTGPAITLTFVVCNAVIVLRKQLVATRYANYMKDKADFVEAEKRRAAGTPPIATPNPILFDLKLFELDSLPLDQIKDLVFNKLSLSPRAQCLVTTLQSEHSGLQTALTNRKVIVESFKSLPDNDLPYHYFGIKHPTTGSTHEEYSDSLEMINNYATHITFYSHLLCTDLEEYGRRLTIRFSEKYGQKGMPELPKLDFSDARAAGWIPPESAYENWLKGFKSTVRA